MSRALTHPVLRRLGRIAGLVAAFASPPLFSASELHFRNGDRLTGELVLRANGKITFQSPILGTITVDEAAAAVVDIPDAPVESLAGLPPAAAAPQPAKPADARPAANIAEAPPSTDPATAAPAPALGPKATWKGKLEVGFINQSGRRDRMDLSFRADAEKKSGKNAYRGEGRYLYAKSNGAVASDREDAAFRWRHDLSERLFSQSVTSYYSDEIKQIEKNAEQNVGMGYKVLDRPHHVVNLGGGVTAQYRESPVSGTGWAHLLETFQDYTWKLNGRLTLLQNATALYMLESLGSRSTVPKSPGNTSVGYYRLRFNSTLQGKITEQVSMNVRYEFEHDATIANPDLRDDMRVTSSIGYAF